VVFSTPPGAAQTEPIADSAEPEALAPLVADRLARDALLLLRAMDSPRPEDYALVARLLERADGIDDANPSLARLIVRAWRLAGDEGRVIEWTRRVVREDPSDEPAVLRLISDRIARLQSIEDRRSAYERLLGAGSALDPAIRSRLALDDALLAREFGDEARFLERLSQALELDPTNKQAAALAVATALPTADDPLERVELIANLVLADPLDPASLRDLAEAFMSVGAYSAAERFFNLARRRIIEDDPLAARAIRGRLILANWATEGTRPLLDLLDQSERAQRHAIEQRRQAAIDNGDDPAEIPDYTPDALNETVRLGLTLALGDTHEARRSLDRLLALAEARQADAQAAGADPDEAARVRQANARERLWLRLWAGMDLDEAEADLDDPEGLGEGAPLDLYRGVLLAQRGEIDAARELLAPLADADPRARLGLAVAAERAGDREGATHAYARVALDAAGELWGVYARARLETLRGAPVPPSAVAQRLEAYARAMPDTVDKVVNDPRSIIALRAEFVDTEPAPFDRLELRITIRNTSPIPLAVGPDAPISSDVLLAPRVSIGTRDARENLTPEVVSLARRLRLDPGESLTTTIWADRGALGTLLDRSALVAALVRIRAIQRFVVTDDARYIAADLSVSADTDPIRRRPIATPRGGAGALPDLIRAATGRRLAETALLAFNVVGRARANPDAPALAEQVQAVADAFTERLGGASAFERFMLTRLLPAESASPPFAPAVDLLRQDADPLVRLAFVMTRAADPADPILDLAEASDDALVRDTARAVRRVLAAQAEARAADAGDQP